MEINLSRPTRFFRALLLFGTACQPVTAQAEKLTAMISFLEIQSQETHTSRTHRQPRNIKVLIANEHRVIEWSARRADQPDQHSLSFESVLGSRTQVEKVIVEWRFENRNVLVRQTEFPSFVETIKLTFQAGKCDAKIDYQLKQGYHDFGMWGLDNRRPIAYRSIDAENTQCEVHEENIS